MKRYDICKVSNALLRKTDEDIWNQIYDSKYENKWIRCYFIYNKLKIL